MNWWALRRKIHTSWLVAIVCVAIVCGVALTRVIDHSYFSSVIWCLAAVLAVTVVLWLRYIALIPLIIMSGLVVGIWRGSLEATDLRAFDHLYGTSITVTGVASDDVDSDAQGGMTVRVNAVRIDGKPMAGSLWISTATDATIQRGYTVTVTGKLSPGFGSMSGSMYRATVKNVARPEPPDGALAVRDWFAGLVREAVPDPEASLGIGFLVGQRRSLPPELAEALRIAGLTHIVVASGYNLTILVRLARRLFVKISKRFATWSAGVMILGFIAITGASPSMSRAGLVAGLSLAAWYYGRKFHPLVLLPFAAAVTGLLVPSYAWGDLGWQLSFAAFGGVMILAPLLQRYFWGEKKPGIIRQILGETIAATICTAPIIIAAFGQISNVTVIANLLVLPLVPLAMLLTCIAGIGALIFPIGPTIIGLPAYWILHYMTSAAQYLAGLPWAVSQLQFSWVHVFIWYMIVTVACVYLWRVTKYNLRDANIVE